MSKSSSSFVCDERRQEKQAAANFTACNLYIIKLVQQHLNSVVEFRPLHQIQRMTPSNIVPASRSCTTVSTALAATKHAPLVPHFHNLDGGQQLYDGRLQPPG
uniref:uncharacterized protein LOC125906452 n=1 Tax=Anopheles coluzzii TaxID=1518534 RepID=UPI001AAD3A26|nr:uncharacterized protein LOC125906452 [Anopheles coluzzii]XP_049463990.1 uncharacterized protein LOC125906930 [Anopheles coluzzii]